MKAFITALLLCVPSAVSTIRNLEPITDREDLFASAIISIIQQFYSKLSNNVFVTSNKTDTMHDSILRRVFASLDSNISTAWLLHDQDYLNGITDRMSNVILIDSYESFRLTVETITTTSLDSFGYYTIVKTNSLIGQNENSDLINIFREFWHNNNIINVNILTYANATRPSVLLHTYFPFTPTHCGKIEPVIWNSFQSGHFLQANKHIFPSKTANLFHCPVSLLVAPYRPYIFIAGNNSDGSYNFDGMEYVLLHEISKQINFTLNTSIYWGESIGSVNYENKTAFGAFGMIQQRQHEMLVGALLYEYFLKILISSTVPYTYEDLMLVVPYPRHYTAFETIFFPFTITSWMCIVMTIAIAVAVIKFLQCKGKQYYPYVVGVNVGGGGSPYFNLISVLVTAGTVFKPAGHFARFLLMVWTLASIVFQNVYQGQLFTFIKKNQMVPSVKTFDELMKNGISIKLDEGDFGPFLKFDTRLKGLLKFIDPSTEWEFVTETEAYVTFEIRLADDVQRKVHTQLDFRKPHTITISKYTHIVYLVKRFYLKESLDEKITYMNENGLIFKWSVSSRDNTLLESAEENIPRKLNILQILGMLQVWFGLLMLATIVFALELLSFAWSLSIPEYL